MTDSNLPPLALTASSVSHHRLSCLCYLDPHIVLNEDIVASRMPRFGWISNGKVEMAE